MIPFILPNLYHRLSKLPVKDLESDSNYYDWMTDIWKYVEPSYEAFYAWSRQRCEGEVTDLGCGDGNVGKNLNATHFYDYVQSFEGVKFIDLTSDELPELEGDTFVLSHVLEHLYDPKKALANLHKALKSNDRLIICVPNGGDAESTALPFQQYIPSNDATSKHLHHVYAWTCSDLFNSLVNTGWDDVEIATTNVTGFSCIWALAIKK